MNKLKLEVQANIDQNDRNKHIGSVLIKDGTQEISKFSYEVWDIPPVGEFPEVFNIRIVHNDRVIFHKGSDELDSLNEEGAERTIFYTALLALVIDGIEGLGGLALLWFNDGEPARSLSEGVSDEEASNLVLNMITYVNSMDMDLEAIPDHAIRENVLKLIQDPPSIDSGSGV